jgi:NitT/TauT family transport system permease protein
VIIPASVTDVYTDMRILLGWAWTYLIVAEVVGTMSGITYFINQQARYRNFDNVYAAIAMIGIIGFSTDLLLAWIGTILFPWKRKSHPSAGLLNRLVRSLRPKSVETIASATAGPLALENEEKSSAKTGTAELHVSQ